VCKSEKSVFVEVLGLYYVKSNIVVSLAKTFHREFCRYNFFYYLKLQKLCIYYVLLGGFKVESQSCENDAENQIRLSIRAKLNGVIYSNFRCNNIVLNELLDELNGIKLELASKLSTVLYVIKLA
jgi:hypothetical protein